jgi:elongation factor P--(R)-beta-lysine ligase
MGIELSDDWRPTASLDQLVLRANVYKQIRQFFEARQVLEVETPLLCHATVTNPHIASFNTALSFTGNPELEPLFLQTSPEYAMKRLLAAGVGSIFQICKAFRNGEYGRYHNPEFTLLEWYRLGFTHHDLMSEVDALLETVLATPKADKISYTELFEMFFSINPHTASQNLLKDIANRANLSLVGDHPRDTWLDLLMTHLLEPQLGLDRPIFVFDYPYTQAALARISTEEDYQVAERFELYYKGVELANGYHELCNSAELLCRFEANNMLRKQSLLPIVPIDNYLLEAQASFPECAGVALGMDRLLCLATGSNNLADVIAFPITRA